MINVLEREIRALLKEFPSCELRIGCEVINREEDRDHTVVRYLDQNGVRHSIRTSWLVGADGKRGVVRKRFLEPEGIKQEDGAWTYVGTWVATNLKITTPTPESHPDFPLWRLGYTPEQVLDAFWPSGFQSVAVQDAGINFACDLTDIIAFATIHIDRL